MTRDKFDTADDISDINDARAVLDVDQEATNADIEAAFEAKAADASGEAYWKFVKAREILLSDSIPGGPAIYLILRKKPTPDSVLSLSQAEKWLNLQDTSPQQIGSDSYQRILQKSHDQIQERLNTLLRQDDAPISRETIQAVEICYHSLRLNDLEKGRQWVMGTKANSREPTGDSEVLGGWKYSLNRQRHKEYYTAQNSAAKITIEPLKDDTRDGFKVILSRGETEVSSEYHPRYGNAKRQVKRWVIEESTN